MTTTESTADSGRGVGGRRFVVVLYGLLVGVSALLGVLFTLVVDDPAPPELFFLFELPPTALGFGLYGGVTVAVVLGVPLLLVVAVSTFVDDVDAVGRDDVEPSGGGHVESSRRADIEGGGRTDIEGDGRTDTEASGTESRRSTESPKD